jgi:penicillin-binding protein 1A
MKKKNNQKWKILLLAALLLIVFPASLVGSVYFYYLAGLPEIKSLLDYAPPIPTEVYSDDNIKIGEFYTQRRYVIPYDEIPELVVKAFVASEDDRFWEHKGIDYTGIMRAFFKNLAARKIVQGGSTITQQITKSLLLTSERSIRRKIREVILATRIESF